MKRTLLLLAVLLATALSGCNGSAPYVRTVGELRPGTRMELRVAGAQVEAYAPLPKQPTQAYTIEATALAAAPPPPSIVPDARGIVVNAPSRLADLLVRVPPGVDLVVRSAGGDIDVSNVGGNVDLATRHGSIHALLDGYARARVGVGNITVTMGALAWPGTLHFHVDKGDVTLFVAANAHFHVHMQTDRGTIFTNYGFRGTSKGTSERLDGSVGAANGQGISIVVRQGSIRLLRMMPQA